MNFHKANFLYVVLGSHICWVSYLPWGYSPSFSSSVGVKYSPVRSSPLLLDFLATKPVKEIFVNGFSKFLSSFSKMPLLLLRFQGKQTFILCRKPGWRVLCMPQYPSLSGHLPAGSNCTLVFPAAPFTTGKMWNQLIHRKHSACRQWNISCNEE